MHTSATCSIFFFSAVWLALTSCVCVCVCVCVCMCTGELASDADMEVFKKKINAQYGEKADQVWAFSV